MRMIFKVSFYVRSNYENKNGKSPLMIRIYFKQGDAECRFFRT